MVMAPHPTCDLASMAAWLSPQAIPTTKSSPTSPLFASLQSAAALTLGLLHNPKLQLPAAAPSRGSTFLSRVCMAAQGLSDSHSI